MEFSIKPEPSTPYLRFRVADSAHASGPNGYGAIWIWSFLKVMVPFWVP